MKRGNMQPNIRIKGQTCDMKDPLGWLAGQERARTLRRRDGLGISPHAPEHSGCLTRGSWHPHCIVICSSGQESVWGRHRRMVDV